MSEINEELETKNSEVTEHKKKQSFFSRLRTKYRNKKLEQIQNEKLSDEENQKVEEKIEEVTKEVEESKTSTKKKRIKNIIFFVFNVVLVVAILLWNIFTTEDFTPFNISDLNFVYILVVIVLLVGVNVLDMMSVHRMIYRKTLRSRWALSYTSLGILRYYDAVTPLSSGGQAFMVTYLTGRDVPGATALSIPIAKLLFQQIAWLLVTFICLIVSFSCNMTTLVSAASIIGFILCFLMVLVILFLSLSKKFGTKMVSWGLKLLVKMRILKNYEKHYNKVMNFVQDYQNIMKEYSKAKFDIMYQLVLKILRFLLFFSIPFFIYCAFRGFDGSKFWEFFIYTALIDLASSFIPLPGGTGMNEITFTALFKSSLGGQTFWALLIWRFCSYYFYLLQGLGIMSYDTIYGNRKYRWLKTKYDLQEESQEFRKTQIESFRQERNKRRKSKKNKKI